MTLTWIVILNEVKDLLQKESLPELAICNTRKVYQ